MKDIDWSKAPEGATHYYPEDTGVVGRFYNMNKSPMWVDFCGWAGWQVSNNKPEGLWLDTLVARPTTPQWNGTGLPPVGVVCEIEHHREWVRCEILAHKTFNDLPGLVHAIAWIDKDTVDQSSGIRFRQIRTPEQIAADERKAAIDRMMHTIECYDNEARLHCGMLYDALYRKTERTTGAE